MKLRQIISLGVAASFLMLIEALPARQTEENPQPPAKTEKKKHKKPKKEAGENAGAARTAVPAEPPQTAPPVTQPPVAPKNVPKSVPPANSALRAAPTVSQNEISAARARGDVWVNTQTGVYHKSGRWYGATKEGKFMSEQDAVRAGYHAAKR
jgi:hypothetical protein